MIEPVLYRKPMAGKTKSHIIQFSDGNDYVVKFYRRGFERVLPNEWIGYCIARFLDLPVPRSQLVTVPLTFAPDLWQADDVVYTCAQFATLYLPDAINLRQLSESRDTVRSVVHPASLAGIIVLDYWLNNRDRNRNNVLVSSHGGDSHQFWMIDQGDLFGACNWSLDQLQTPEMALYSSVTHKWMAQFIEDEKAFKTYLDVVRTIPKLLIEEIIMLIPEDWGISEEDKSGVVRWLLYRRDKQLKPLIERFIQTYYRSLQHFRI